MRFILSIIIFIIHINLADVFGQELLKIKDKCIFLSGVNIPWHYFGADIGNHDEWGSLYDSLWFDNSFSEISQYDLNCIRFWLHCDGRASPEFDEDGYVTGLDSNFFINLDDFFQRAEKYGLYVILCLWSYDMLKDRTDEAGKYAGKHYRLITSLNLTESYIINALLPIVKRYEYEDRLLAYEIINEPEWCIVPNKHSDCEHKASPEDMQTFVAKCAAAIHRFSDKLVTVGSGSLRWSWYNAGATDNYWTDEALMNAADDSLSYLDFYEIHYYDWMYDLGNNPFDSSPLFWNMGKPVIVGELPAQEGKYKVGEMMRMGLSNGWAGFFTWSYLGKDGAGKWDNCKNEHLNFYNEFHHLIVGKSCDSIYVSNESEYINIFPNPANSLLKIKFNAKGSEDLQVSIYDMIGESRSAFNVHISDYGNVFYVDVTMLNRGIYYLVIKKDSGIVRARFMRN